MNGIIIVYKEKGYTSHDVVARMRGILKIKKIGHTGTLDPDAEGVLPVCIGTATKVCEMLTDTDKTYIAELILGQSTTTQDISGEVISKGNVNVNEDLLEKTIKSFIGDYSQIPPMYSALKHNGKKLYEYAREGIDIERQPRNVIIYNIDILNYLYKDNLINGAVIEVNCSKGTYIRTLCNDIGEKLGCYACMGKLKRTKVGKFNIDDAKKLNEIEAIVKNNNIEDIIINADKMFLDYKPLTVNEDNNELLHNGNVLYKKSFTVKNDFVIDNENFRVYDIKDEFMAIYQYRKKDGLLKPVKMFKCD